MNAIASAGKSMENDEIEGARGGGGEGGLQ